MTKLCSVCGTENREEAQFCRACGTAFAAAPAAGGSADDAASNTCSECGFHNKPGLRYCANCGMSLAAPSDGAAPAAADAPYASPPPISYPSFAPVAPYPAAPSAHELPPPDIPDPDVEIALLQQQAASDAASPFSAPATPNRAPLVIGVFAALLAVAAVGAWIFMRDSNSSPPAVGTTTTPMVAVPVPGSAPTTASVIVEAAPASGALASTASASAVESPAAAGMPAPLGAPPTAAAALPQVANPGETPEEEAKRVAAEKKREKAARDKADRDAKATAAADQSAAAAALHAEQDAQARRRAEEAQRAHPTAAAPTSPAPAPVAQARGVREICAGRGTIAEAVCQSRQCGAAEHANEPICRQLRESDERRRNMLP